MEHRATNKISARPGCAPTVRASKSSRLGSETRNQNQNRKLSTPLENSPATASRNGRATVRHHHTAAMSGAASEAMRRGQGVPGKKYETEYQHAQSNAPTPRKRGNVRDNECSGLHRPPNRD